MTHALPQPDPLSHFPWPDLDAPNDTTLQTSLILAMRPAVRETLTAGLWRAAHQRQRVRKGLPRLTALEPQAAADLPLPRDRAQGGVILSALCDLLEWALEVLELPTRCFQPEGRQRMLMLVFSRLSWLDGLVVQSYGAACSLLVWNAVLGALLPE